MGWSARLTGILLAVAASAGAAGGARTVLAERTFAVSKDDFIGWKALTALVRREFPDESVSSLGWTPFLPTRWPVKDGALEVVSYGYRSGLKPGLADAQLEFPPAFAVYVPLSLVAGRGRILRLKVDEKRAEPQGVRPLTADESRFVNERLKDGATDASMRVWKAAQKAGADKMTADDARVFAFWHETDGAAASFVKEDLRAFWRFVEKRAAKP